MRRCPRSAAWRRAASPRATTRSSPRCTPAGGRGGSGVFASRTFAVVALLATLLLAACGGRTPQAPGGGGAPRDPAPAAGFRVFATGDTRGHLDPCGCDEGVFGGLARRATYLRAARKPGDLYLDLGNAVEGDSADDRIVLGHALRGLRALGCDLVVPGEHEVRLGADLQALAGREGLRVVSANVRRGGNRVFPAWYLHELPDGRRIGVVGVTEAVELLPDGWVAGEPEPEVREALAELQGRADAVIVAAAVDEDTGRRLEQAFPTVRLVLAGRARAATKTLDGRLMALGDEGQYVARVDFGPDLVARSAKQTWLGPEFAEEADLAAVAAAARAELSAANADVAARIVASLRVEGFAGSGACRDCHEAEHDVWKESRHAHAVHALEAKNATRDPRCLTCHLRDVPPEGDEGGLGCEACHGPGARHVEAARATPRRSEPMQRLAGTGATSCVGCHDPANSPRFDLATYWPKIAHGEETPR